VRLWTLKEAYVKAVGRGIGARPGLNAFSVMLQPRTGVHINLLFSTSNSCMQSVACFIRLGCVNCIDEEPKLWTCAGPAPGNSGQHSIQFASPEDKPGAWDFLLFHPSPQHTAALCVERHDTGSEGVHDTHSSEDGCDTEQHGGSAAHPADSGDSNPAAWADSSDAHSPASDMCGRKDGFRLRCWRTVPLVQEAVMGEGACVILGS
jgi:hypothetical protein